MLIIYLRFIKDLKNSVSSVVKTPTPCLHLANAFPPCSQRLAYFLQIPRLPSKYFPCKTSGITRILVTFDPFL